MARRKWGTRIPSFHTPERNGIKGGWGIRENRKWNRLHRSNSFI